MQSVCELEIGVFVVPLLFEGLEEVGADGLQLGGREIVMLVVIRVLAGHIDLQDSANIHLF